MKKKKLNVMLLNLIHNQPDTNKYTYMQKIHMKQNINL